jgi:hypothetical protein
MPVTLIPFHLIDEKGKRDFDGLSVHGDRFLLFDRFIAFFLIRG